MVEVLKKQSETLGLSKIPLIFISLVGFLTDQDAKVRKSAAQALKQLIQRDPNYVSTQLPLMLQTVQQALHTEITSNLQQQTEANAAMILTLHDLILTLPPDQRPNLRPA